MVESHPPARLFYSSAKTSNVGMEWIYRKLYNVRLAVTTLRLREEKCMSRLLFLLLILAVCLTTLQAGTIMYGVNGGHNNPDGSPLSINNGWLVIVDQTTGAVTPVGHPAGVSKLSGVAFETNGDLFATALSNVGYPPPVPSSPTTTLVKINPATGALLANIGPITAGGTPLQIADLAVQPFTGVLFGISASSSGDVSAAGNLYVINTTTGVATLV